MLRFAATPTDPVSLPLLIEILPSPSLLWAPSAASLLGQIPRVFSLVARCSRGSSRRDGSVQISISSASPAIATEACGD